MSAFDRLPADYRDRLKDAARIMSPRDRHGGFIHLLSPQNRRVRLAVDTYIARSKDLRFPGTFTRQQARRT